MSEHIANLMKILKILNYPENVSEISFNQANFPLICRILIWFGQLFDPKTQFELNQNTEEERIAWIRSIGKFLYIKSRININLRNIYKADNDSVPELLQIGAVLMNSIEFIERNKQLTHYDHKFHTENNALFSKKSKVFINSFVTKSTNLLELLKNEVNTKDAIEKSLHKNFDFSEIEKFLRQEIERIRKNTEQVENLIIINERNIDNLSAKISNRQIELDRYKNRIHSLKKFKPIYSDEYSELKNDLEQLYEQYTTKYQNLLYLENKFNEVSDFEDKKFISHKLEGKKSISMESIETDEEFVSSYQTVTKSKMVQKEFGKNLNYLSESPKEITKSIEDLNEFLLDDNRDIKTGK